MSKKSEKNQSQSIFGQLSDSVRIRRERKVEEDQTPDISQFRDGEGNIDPFDLLEAGIIKIEVSTDPYEFAFFDYNRNCNPAHLAKMEKSLRKNNLLPCNPILTMDVPEDQTVFYHDGTEVEDSSSVRGVTDGQHRFGGDFNNSVKEDRPFRVAYIHIPAELGDAAEIMKMFNTANKNWNNDDLIVNGANSPVSSESHREACSRALHLLDTYDWMKTTTALAVCGITTHSLKKGEASARIEPQETARILEEVQNLVSIDPDFFSSLKDNKTVRAYIQVRKEENFDFDRLYEALHTSFHRNENKRRAKLVVSHSAKIVERKIALKKAHNQYTGGDFKESPKMGFTQEEMDEVLAS